MSTPTDDTLGPCGCVDYHLADCPIRTAAHDAYLDAERALDAYGDDDPGGIDRAWEDDYRAHSSSHTGLYEANE